MTSQHQRLVSPGVVWWERCSLILLALVVAGCGATATEVPGGASSAPTNAGTPAVFSSGSTGDRVIPSVVLRNPSPGTLDISLSLTFDQLIGDTQPMVEVGLGFASGDHTIQFAGDERVTCDGANPPLKDRAAVFQVLRAPAVQEAGKTVHCDYEAGGAVAGISLQIPTAPAITSPQPGAHVTRSAETLVTYQYDAATGSIRGFVALGPPTSRLAKAIANLNTRSPWHATVDTSTFAPGAGSLVLTMSLAPHFFTSGAPFKSTHVFGDATVPVAVTWI